MKYFVNDVEVERKEFEESLEFANRDYNSGERFEEWLDEYYAPYGVEVADCTFAASEILLKLRPDVYAEELAAYIKDQLNVIWDELESTNGEVFVGNDYFEIKDSDEAF